MHKVSVEVVVAVAKFSKVSIMLCRTFDSIVVEYSSTQYAENILHKIAKPFNKACDSIVVEYSSTQYVEKILHQIAKSFNKAYTGLRSKLSIFRICFA